MEEKSTFKIILEIIKRRFNIRTLFILVLLLGVNSYAWFVYSTKVAGGVTAKVKAWNVLFEVGEQEITQNINFNLDDLYPGMKNYTENLTVTNRGDEKASFSYTINSANILGTIYTKSDVLTSNNIKDILSNNYPFAITIGTSSSNLEPGSQATFSIGVVWPFESGDDIKDTYWGNTAYAFKENNPDSPSISIDITITAVQSQN